MRKLQLSKHIGGLVLSMVGLLPQSGYASSVARNSDVFEFAFVSITGEPMPLSQFKNKTLLIVNTASFCGFTRQYAQLQDVWQRYRDKGLVIVGVPSNDFGGQEPGSDAEIQEFCSVNFDIDFPLTSKVQVKGKDAHPFYQWTAQAFGPAAQPRWNFHKYLFSPKGQPVAWFSTSTSPTSRRVLNEIEKHLPGPDSKM